MFYVYEWYNKDTNEIFYVGKGCRNRYKQTKRRNKKFEEYHKNNPCEVRIIKTFESEQDALKYQHQRIVELKNQNQCFCNLDDGGKGGVNFIWTPQMREYMSKNNPMKDQKQKQRMSEHNPMKNPQIAKKVGLKHARAVIINGIRYESVVKAAQELNVAEPTIRDWCKKGKNSKNWLCRYQDEEQKFNPKHRRSKPVMYKNKIYQSGKILASQLNVTPTTISSWCKKGYDSKGNECRFATQEQISNYKE